MKKRKGLSTVFIVIVLIWLLVPLLVSLIYSLFENWAGIVPKGFTLQAYASVLTDPQFGKALLDTVLICIVPILLTNVIVLLALFVVTAYFPRLEKYVQIICMVPYTVQGVILSVSILSLYVGGKGFFASRVVMLTGAYCIIILPYVYQGIRNSMRSVNMPMLLDAAQMLGCSRIEAFFKVVVPNIMSGIIVSSLLAVGIIFGDYVLIRNLAGSTVTNLQMYLYQVMKADSRKSSATFILIMLVMFLITTVVLVLKAKNDKGQKERWHG